MVLVPDDQKHEFRFQPCARTSRPRADPISSVVSSREQSTSGPGPGVAPGTTEFGHGRSVGVGTETAPQPISAARSTRLAHVRMTGILPFLAWVQIAQRLKTSLEHNAASARPSLPTREPGPQPEGRPGAQWPARRDRDSSRSTCWRKRRTGNRCRQPEWDRLCGGPGAGPWRRTGGDRFDNGPDPQTCRGARARRHRRDGPHRRPHGGRRGGSSRR